MLSADEVKSNPSLSHQHRGGIEYQIGITLRNLADFDEYLVLGSEVGDEVVSKGR